MRKYRWFQTIVILAIITSGCKNPLVPDGNQQETGILLVSLERSLPQTLYPIGYSLDVYDYLISGNGPATATFTETITTTTMPSRDLVVGEWTINVLARNEMGDILGEGQAIVTIESAVVSTVTITVSPLVGNGTLNLSLFWPSSELSVPTVEARLTPIGGAEMAVNFEIDAASGTATYSGTHLNSFYSLILRLWEDGLASPSWGLMESVLIVKGETTVGDYTISSGQLNLPPDAPTGLTKSSFSSTEVNLSWMDNSATESAFVIERNTNGAGFREVVEIGEDITTYADTSVVAGNTYSYRVVARNAWGDSSATNVVEPLPTAPANMVASEFSSRQIDVNWIDNSDNETGFLIERSVVSGSGFATIGTVDAAIMSYLDQSILAETTYYYRVKAIGPFGDSNYSNEASGIYKLPVVTSLLPAGGGTTNDTAPTLSWDDETEAEYYHLVVANDIGFSNVIIDRSDIAGPGYAFSGTGNELLANGDLCYWKVAVIDTDGKEGDFSSSYSFTVDIDLDITIDPDMDEPFEITLTGLQTFNVTTSITVTANIVSTIDEIWWRVDGIILTTEKTASLAFGNDLPIGIHTLGVTIRSGDVYSSASTSFYVKAIEIGDSFAGGIVFYFDGNGGGLVAADYDQNDGVSSGVWGGYGDVVGSPATGIGAGVVNTISIVNAYGDSEPYERRSDYAAARK